MSETEVKERGIAYRLAKIPMVAVLRTRTLSETRGFLKALIDTDSDRILGFTALGAFHYAEKACSAQGIRYWPVQRIDGKLCATERGLTKTIMSKQVLAIRDVSFAGSINQISVTFTL